MKRLVLLLTLLLCLPLSAHADDASKRAKVQEMFALLHMDKLIGQMMDGIMKQASSNAEQMFGTNLTPDNKAKLDHFQAQLYQLLQEKAGWKALEPEYTDLYVQTYTEEELDAILAFYKSPAGASMIAKTPELTSKSMAISQTRIMAILPQVKQMMDDFIRDASKTTSTPPPPAETPKP